MGNKLLTNRQKEKVKIEITISLGIWQSIRYKFSENYRNKLNKELKVYSEMNRKAK